MRISSSTVCGSNHRINEDAYECGRLADGTHFAVLCDGMGGVVGGLEASNFVVDYLAKAVLDEDFTMVDDLKAWMIEKTEACNEILFAKSVETTGRVTMGTTVVFSLLRESKLRLVHSGDSRAYYLDGHRENEITRLTKDHSIVQELLDSGRITEEQALKHPNKNIITSALGVERHPRIDYHEMDVYHDDYILLCSDGITNTVSDSYLRELITDTEFYSCARKIVSEAQENGSQDDMTVLLINI